MKKSLSGLAILFCLCANASGIYDGAALVGPPPRPPAPHFATPIDNHGDPSKPVGVYIDMQGTPSAGRAWGGDPRSIVYSIDEARFRERQFRGLSGRDRYLLQRYPTPEAYAQIAPMVSY